MLAVPSEKLFTACIFFFFCFQELRYHEGNIILIYQMPLKFGRMGVMKET